MMRSVEKEEPVYTSVSEDNPLRGRDPHVATSNFRDGLFASRGRFLKLILVGLAVMTLLGAAACGG